MKFLVFSALAALACSSTVLNDQAYQAVNAKIAVPQASFESVDSRQKAEAQMAAARMNWHSFFTERKKP